MAAVMVFWLGIAFLVFVLFRVLWLRAATVKNPRSSGTVRKIHLPGTSRGYFVEVVGESYRQDVLKKCLNESGRERLLDLILVPEPENPSDANAVAILTLGNQLIGYLKREVAPRYQPTLIELQRRGLTTTCSGKLVGGESDKPSIGVWLDLEAPTILAKAVAVKYRRVSQPKPNAAASVARIQRI
jgi:hypothetical protein